MSRALKNMSIIICLATSPLYASDELSKLDMVDAAAPGDQAGSSSRKTNRSDSSSTNRKSDVKKIKLFPPCSVKKPSIGNSGIKNKWKNEEGSAAMPGLFYVDKQGRIYLLTRAKERLIVISQSSCLTSFNPSARDVKVEERLDEPFDQINEEIVKQIIDANDRVYTEGLEIILRNYYQQSGSLMPDHQVNLLLKRLAGQKQ